MARMATVLTSNASAEPSKSATARPGKVKGFDYSKFRQSLRRPEDFEKYLEGYPDKMGLLAYVYRLSPRIDNALIGVSENSILKTANPAEMTRDFIAGRFGRGEYMLKLNDANRPKGENEACRTFFNVDDPDLASIYDPRTLLLSDPKNQEEVARLLQSGVLVRDSSTNGPRLRTEADTVVPSSLPVKAEGSELLSRDVVGQLIMKLVDRGAQSPGDQMKQSIEIAKLLQGAAAPAAAQLSQEQVIELAVARLQAKQPASGGGDLFDNYEKLDAFVSKVRGPGGAVGGEGNWVTSMAALVAALGSVIPLVVRGVETLRAERGAVVVMPANTKGGQVQQQQSMADRISFIAQLGFRKMEEGTTGFDFAGWVCAWHPGGLEVYDFLAPNGPTGVMSLASMNPDTAVLLRDPVKRAQIETFLDDFFSFDPHPVEESAPVGPGSAAA
jgi:hypothetical protein